MYMHISTPNARQFLPQRLQGALGQTSVDLSTGQASDLPTKIEQLATDASQAIQATLNPNAPPYTGNLTNPLASQFSSFSAPTAVDIGAVIAIGALAFFIARGLRGR